MHSSIAAEAEGIGGEGSKGACSSGEGEPRLGRVHSGDECRVAAVIERCAGGKTKNRKVARFPRRVHDAASCDIKPAAQVKVQAGPRRQVNERLAVHVEST